jgi:molybdate/tungstate transport system ATP-binding protein
MIRLVDVVFRAGAFELGSVDVEIERGEYFAVLGPTGAGKTKLLELIAGLATPSSGDVWIDGENVTRLPPERRRVGLMYQDYLLFPHLSVRRNIQFGLRELTKRDAEQSVDDLSRLLGLEQLLDRSIAGLSGGEQQRVALARALAPKPRVLLLDEPLSALDPQNRRAVRRELKSIHSQLGTTTIHVTHDFEEALVVADRLAVMNQGKIVQVGQPEEVVRKPRSAFVADFFGVENIFKGEIMSCGETGELGSDAYNAVFSTGGLKMSVIAEREGPAYATIRPEDVLVSRELVHSSAMNNLSGSILEVEMTGPLVRLTADVGARLVALITRQSLSALKLEIGAKAFFSVKASAIHIFW